LKTILRQQESADPDCTGSKSRQYDHILGLEYTCTGAALCPYRLNSGVLLAQNRHPHPPLSHSIYNLLLYGCGPILKGRKYVLRLCEHINPNTLKIVFTSYFFGILYFCLCRPSEASQPAVSCQPCWLPSKE